MIHYHLDGDGLKIDAVAKHGGLGPVEEIHGDGHETPEGQGEDEVGEIAPLQPAFLEEEDAQEFRNDGRGYHGRAADKKVAGARLEVGELVERFLGGGVLVVGNQQEQHAHLHHQGWKEVGLGCPNPGLPWPWVLGLAGFGVCHGLEMAVLTADHKR